MIDKLYAFAVGIDADRIGIPQVRANDATFNNIIGLVYVVIGALSLFYIVRGALLFVTSQGNPNDIKAARTTILVAAGALVLSTMVFGIVNYFIANAGKT